MYTTDMYESMIAETVTISGYNNDNILAYFARPLHTKPRGSMILIHHLPGWDEWYKEVTRKFAYHGYLAICPNLYHREGHGDPVDIASKVRSDGGIADDQAMADVQGSYNFLQNLPYMDSKVGVFGTCSGGRHAFLAACTLQGISAAVDLWGGGITQNNNSQEPWYSKQPVAPIEYTKDLSCPLLGLFGQEDASPSPEQVSAHEQELKTHGKDYEFHMYPDAGHGFFYHDRPVYRQAQAVDGWKKVFVFLGKTLG